MRQTLQTLLLVLLLALPGWSQDGPLRQAALRHFTPGGNLVEAAAQMPVKRNGQRPTAAPVANNVTTYVAFNSGAIQIPNLQYTTTSPNTISTVSVTMPTTNTAKGTLYAFNAGNNANAVIPANGTAVNYSFVTYPNLGFGPANGFTGPYTFTYTVTDNTGATSNSATYTIYVGAPTAKPQTSQILLSAFAATPLSLPLVGTPDAATTNAVNGFIIRSLPAGAAGVLALNGSPVAVNQVIATTDAANLTFDPAAGFFGTAVFTYSARDNAGNISASAGYGIPVANGACSFGAATNQRSVLDFTTRAIGENFAATNSITVDGVTVTASPAAYPFTTGANTQSSLDVQDLGGLPGKGIAWQQNYSTGSTNSSSVTFTFSKPVANFTVTVGDIDRNTTTTADQEYIDRIVFNGYDANGNLITLSSANVSAGVANTFSGSNGVTATANSTSDPANNITVTFPQSITRLTLIYSNQTANADPGFQFASIPQFEWCNAAVAAAVTTTISGPSTAVVGQSVQYTATTTNNGGQTATNDVVTITLPNKPAASTVTVTNGTYDPNTGIVTFAPQDIASGATVTNTVRFVAQASPTTVTGTAASTSNTFDADASDNNGSAANANVSTVVSPTGAAGTPAPCATAGKDGAVTLSTNPNAYYPSIAAQTLAVNATSIQVGPARGAATSIAPGDLLLVIQMQGADIDASNTDSYGDGIAGGPAYGSSVTTNFTAGTYEYVAVAAGSATVTAAAGGTITLATGLKNSYINAAATSSAGQRTFQVVRIPQYSTLTLAANIVPAAWDGSTGGIIALGVAGQLNMAGYSIDASGKGFRGGAGRQLGGEQTSTPGAADYRFSSALNTGGTKGEGIVGTPRYVNNNNALLDTRTSPLALPAGLNDGYPSGDNGRGAPGNAGGGGTDSNPYYNDQNTGGGGGANGGRGGRGGNAWNSNLPYGGEPGAAFPAASSSRLVLGGGGGAGTTNDGTGTPGAGFASSGAAGGGLVLVRVGSVTGVGSILANGADANNSVLNDGSGGGGAGGSILVTATNSQAGLANLTLTANGGKGGTNTGREALHGPGGGGGGIILTTGPVAAASAANGAANGTTTSSNSAYGAEAGVNGVANPGISNSIANSVTGSSCIADVATTITGPTNANAASTVTLNVNYSNIGVQNAAGTVRTVVITGLTAATPPTATGGTVSAFNTTNNSYTITYPTVTLNSGTSTPFTITYTAPATGSVTANSSVSTTTTEGGLTANNTAGVTTYVGLVADLTTALTGPTSVTPGQATGNYTATFTNEGPSQATQVTQKVTLPAGATNVFVNGASYTPTGGVIDFGTATTLASGASNSFTFSYTVAAGTTGNQNITSNVGTTGAVSQGANTAPDAATLNVTIAPTANVLTTLTATTPSVVAGTPASATTPPTFTATFNNNGPTTANGVVATVQLPKGLTNVSASNGGVYDPSTGLITYAGLTSIAPNTPTTSVIKFDAPATGPVVATSAISTTTSELGQKSDNQATAAMTITTGFDLTTTLTGPASAVPGSLVTLAVTTTNNGPGAAANAVQTVQLTPGLTNVYVSNGGVYNSSTSAQTIVANGVTYTNVPAGGVVFPTLPNLPSGQTVPNSVSYSQPTTAFAPSALVTPNTTNNGDSNPANNTANLNGAASATNLTNATPAAGTANAYTRITSSVASTTIGSPVTLTVVTGNNGPAQATGVTQKVQILPGFTAADLQVNGAFGTLNTTTNLIEFGSSSLTYSPATGVVTFPTLANGSNGSTSGTSVSNTITFNAPATVGSNGQLLAMAAVSTTNTDPVPADNVSSVAVTLLQRTDLATTITGPSSATIGQTVQYTATFANNGPMGATGVVATAQLPAGLGAVTVTDGSGNSVTATYNATTGQLTLPASATLAAGAAQVFRISFAATGLNMNIGSNVSSTSSDAVAANNSASTPTTIIGVADLATAVSGPATAAVGNPVTYTVLTSNAGTTPAPNAITTLQLATGFTPTTLQVNGQTGTPVGGNVTFADGSVYNASTGVVTFPTVATFAVGASTTNYVTFLMPSNPTNGTINGQIAGTSSVSSDVSDPVQRNNSAGIATSISPTTSTTADLTANVTASASTVAAGGSVTFTATYGNATGSSAAANVRPTLQLQPGLAVADIQEATSPTAPASGTLANGVITFPNGATYNQTTGVVTFPTITSQAAGAGGNVVYSVKVNVPNAGSLTAVAATTSDTSEPNTAAAQANNVFTVPVTITPTFDVVTALAGPASAVVGSSQTYTVTTTNNGPSPTGSTTTQKVTVPAGQTPTNISNGGVYSSATNDITWTIPAGQAAGANGAVANSFTITQPAGGASLTATVSNPTESNTGNDVAYLNGAGALTATTVANQPPLAYAVVNSYQSATGNTNNPMGNTVASNPATPNGLLISPLVATDPENALSTTAPFTITSLPTTTMGTLYFDNGGGSYVAATLNKTLTAAQAATLRFLPAAGFAGNASFTYLSTDASGAQSPVVNYTIPVAADQSTTYSTYNGSKGLTTNKYLTGDILAQTIDPNTAQYNSAGLIYNATTGALQSGAANGLPTTGTNAVLVSGTLPTGVSLDPATGRIYVSNAALLPQSRTVQSFTVNIRTTDINGGTNTVPVTFTIGAYPLPVELTAFTATAKSLDALLAWNTASEKNSDYFDVERSLNGTDFVKIDEVKGQGSTSSATDYARTDVGIGAKVEGLVYYRLKQVDTDGTSSYSPVRSVRFGKVVPAISLFPNPATSATTLDLTALPAGSYQVSVLDAAGRTVLHTTLDAGLAHALQLNTIASGSYTLLVRGTNAGQVINLTKRLVKE